MAKHYKVDNKEKKIYAVIKNLTEAEMSEISKFQLCGYSVVNGKMKEENTNSVKRLDEKYIKDYLKNDDKGLAQYEAEKNAIAKEADGTPKLTKDGKTKKRGFNAGKIWFAKTYPVSIKDLTISADDKKAIDKAFDKYSQGEAAEMTKDEYTRYYYWTKIFTQN